MNPAVVKNTRLVVYRTGLLQGVEGQDHLATRSRSETASTSGEFVFVDAHSGKKVDQITGIQDSLDRRAYDGAGIDQNPPPNYSDTRFWVEGDRASHGAPKPTT